jgi:hypothetical protein
VSDTQGYVAVYRLGDEGLTPEYEWQAHSSPYLPKVSQAFVSVLVGLVWPLPTMAVAWLGSFGLCQPWPSLGWARSASANHGRRLAGLVQPLQTMAVDWLQAEAWICAFDQASADIIYTGLSVDRVQSIS